MPIYISIYIKKHSNETLSLYRVLRPDFVEGDPAVALVAHVPELDGRLGEGGEVRRRVATQRAGNVEAVAELVLAALPARVLADAVQELDLRIKRDCVCHAWASCY